MADDRPPAGLLAGYDPDNPYEETDLKSLPEWWQRNVEIHRANDMRPYRPPRLADGALSPPVLERLEADYGVDLTVRSTDPADGNWALLVDGEPVCELAHERDGGGYTVYGITAAELEAAVREAAGDD